MITADAGGTNGYRLRACKTELATLADDTGVDIGVSHFPPGTSKWNQIEHRMFSLISVNWRAKLAHHLPGHHRADLRPLPPRPDSASRPTTTRTGIRPGVKITNKQLAAVPLEPHEFHGEWNYTITAQSNAA